MGAILRDPKDNRKLARVGNPGDGTDPGDGLITHAILWATEPISGIRRLLRGTSDGSLLVKDAAAIPSLAADNHAPADATPAVVTYAAVVGKKHYIYGIYWAYDAAPTGGSLKVDDVSGTTVFGPLPVTAAGPGFVPFDPPIVSSAEGTAMIVTLASGAGTVQGVLSVRHEAK